MNRTLLLALLTTLALPTPAAAQWYMAGYAGGNVTRPADVTIDQPATGTSVTFEEVRFSAEPLKSPQYYGYRIGRMFGQERRLGVEVEFIHLKVISDTSRTYAVTGSIGGEPASADMRMDAFVRRYSMTHGLNFLLINVVSRTPVGSGRLALVARAGAGPTLPHAETTVGILAQEQYEYAGIAAHVAAGLDVRLRGRLSAMIEYKLTAARPEIDLPLGGRGRMTALSHQIAVGLAFGVSR